MNATTTNGVFENGVFENGVLNEWGSSARSLGLACPEREEPEARHAGWIQQLYQIFLGRLGSVTEVRRCVAELAAGLDPIHLTRALATSREARKRTLDGLYRRYLGRSIDPLGLKHYRAALARGRTRVDIERDLLLSVDYAARQKNSPRGWLRGLYRDVHQRTPDAAGLEYFEQDLHDGPTAKAAIALIFLHSQERREGWIRACYLEILGRSPSADELHSWVRILAAGIPLDELRTDLAASLAPWPSRLPTWQGAECASPGQ